MTEDNIVHDILPRVDDVIVFDGVVTQSKEMMGRLIRNPSVIATLRALYLSHFAQSRDQPFGLALRVLHLAEQGTIKNGLTPYEVIMRAYATMSRLVRATLMAFLKQTTFGVDKHGRGINYHARRAWNAETYQKVGHIVLDTVRGQAIAIPFSSRAGMEIVSPPSSPFYDHDLLVRTMRITSAVQHADFRFYLMSIGKLNGPNWSQMATFGVNHKTGQASLLGISMLPLWALLPAESYRAAPVAAVMPQPLELWISIIQRAAAADVQPGATSIDRTMAAGEPQEDEKEAMAASSTGPNRFYKTLAPRA